jgi:hypothetical protein
MDEFPEVQKAIDGMYGDMSVSKGVARMRLDEVIDYCRMLQDALSDDGSDEE